MRKLPYSNYPVGSQVVFPRDFYKAIGATEQFIPAGTTAHVVTSDPDMIVVVPHVYMNVVSSPDADADWRHEIQWTSDDHEDASPQVVPFTRRARDAR